MEELTPVGTLNDMFISETNVEPVWLDDLRPVNLEPGPGRPLAAPVGGGGGLGRAGPEQGAAPEVQERLCRRVQEGIWNSET